MVDQKRYQQAWIEVASWLDSAGKENIVGLQQNLLTPMIEVVSLLGSAGKEGTADLEQIL